MVALAEPAILGVDPELSMDLATGLKLTAIGLAMGALIAAALSWTMYQTSTTDLRIFATTVLVLVTVAIVAMLIPGLKASRIVPTEALRHQ